MRLVELLLESGYKVIVRPHPETLRHFPKSITFFATKFGNNPNFTLETSVATDDSLLRADVLVSDYSGIVLEYAFGTERPVLFLDVPAKIRNQRFEELGVQPLELSVRSEIGIVVPPEELEDVPRAISNLMLNREAYRKRIIELRKQYVYAFGHSSEIGAKYIIDISMGENH
jgi:YidC/Oxa1 family membrane protein insertase